MLSKFSQRNAKRTLINATKSFLMVKQEVELTYFTQKSLAVQNIPIQRDVNHVEANNRQCKFPL